MSAALDGREKGLAPVLVSHLSNRGGLLPDDPRSADRSLELELPADLSSAAAARRAVQETCRTWGLADASDAVLAASELVTNAVLHAGTPVLLALSLDRDGLTLAVSDGAQAVPWQQPASMTREGGRGIAIVDQLGARWGIVRTVLGKTVWINMAR